MKSDEHTFHYWA